MTNSFPEPDWRVLRDLRPVALDRLCRHILSEIGALSADTRKSNHERYLAIWELLRRRDDEIAEGFNDVSRSRAWMHICVLRRRGLITDEEFARFSASTRDSVESFLKPRAR